MVYNKIYVSFGTLRKITGPALQWQYNDDNQKGGNSMDLQEILDLIDEVEDLEEECEIPPGTWANEMRARAVAHFGNPE